MMLGDFPIRGAVREKKRKLATLSVMISVWIVEIEDAMQSFRNRAISDQAFAYLLCNVISTIERILFLRHCFTTSSTVVLTRVKIHESMKEVEVTLYLCNGKNDISQIIPKFRTSIGHFWIN